MSTRNEKQLVKETELTWIYKLTLIFVLALTGLAFVASIGLSLAPDSENVDRVLQTALTTWQMGFGALAGLIGGRTLP